MDSVSCSLDLSETVDGVIRLPVAYISLTFLKNLEVLLLF